MAIWSEPTKASAVGGHSHGSDTDIEVRIGNDAVIALDGTVRRQKLFEPGGNDAEGALRTLLIVEDDDVDAEHISRLIRRMPGPEWSIVRARSLGEALAALENHEPVVALVDLNLPDAWHDDVVRAIVDCAPDCSVIVQTGSDDRASADIMLELGAQDYLTKGSLTLDTLERSISHAIARHDTLASLVKTWKQLAQANAELDEFAHMVAHDLRAPVRTARMLGDRLLAESDAADSPANADLVVDLGSRLDETLGRIDGLILSMLEYSGLRREEATLGNVALAPLIRSVADAVGADMLEAGGSFQMHVEEDISVWAEEDLLTRAFINLFANSIKYRRPDCQLEIMVTAVKIGDSVEIRVQDNGIGIRPADRQRVFKLLERLNPAGTPGLGFGLAICRRILDNFDGDIRVEDDEGSGGTTMGISIPAHQSVPVRP